MAKKPDNAFEALYVGILKLVEACVSAEIEPPTKIILTHEAMFSVWRDWRPEIGCYGLGTPDEIVGIKIGTE